MNNYIDYNTQGNDSQVQISLFSGYFPKRPKHTCNNMKVLHATSENVKLVNYTQKVWRARDWYENGAFKEPLEVCKGCLYTQVIRQCKQVECEVNFAPNEDWGYVLLSEKEFKKLKNRLKVNKHRNHLATNNKDGNYITKWLQLKYLAIPQPKNNLLLFHNTIELEKSKTIPLQVDKLFTLIFEAVTTMPAKSRVRRSRKFGREYAGKQGYPNNDANTEIKISTEVNIRHVLDDKNTPFKHGKYQIAILPLLDILKAHSIKYKVISGQDKIDSLRVEKQNQLAKEKQVEIDNILWKLNVGVGIKEDNILLLRLGELIGRVV